MKPSFVFPAIDGVTPSWEEGRLCVGNEQVNVLMYGEAQSHWSVSLTALHEKEAGNGAHPIDVASRRLAIETVSSALADRSGEDTPAVIMDIGCSSGFLLHDFKREFPTACLIGADYLTEPLEKLSQHLKGVPLMQFDLRNCPLADNCLDALTLLNVLEHIDDDRKALNEAFRILKPGGMLHLEVPAGPHLYDIYDELLLHHRRYRLSELLRLSSEAGFLHRYATHLGFLIYPLFWLTKKMNRRWLGSPQEVKASVVARQISRTSQSQLLSCVFWLENQLAGLFRWPCGIRCVLRLQKPNDGIPA